jgi:hypothetical protein
MRIARLTPLAGAALSFVLLASTAQAAVDCSIGVKTGNPFCTGRGAVVAPTPSLGSGLAGAMILFGGLFLVSKRRK